MWPASIAKYCISKASEQFKGKAMTWCVCVIQRQSHSNQQFTISRPCYDHHTPRGLLYILVSSWEERGGSDRWGVVLLWPDRSSHFVRRRHFPFSLLIIFSAQWWWKWPLYKMIYFSIVIFTKSGTAGQPVADCPAMSFVLVCWHSK